MTNESGKTAIGGVPEDIGMKRLSEIRQKAEELNTLIERIEWDSGRRVEVEIRKSKGQIHGLWVRVGEYVPVKCYSLRKRTERTETERKEG